MGLRSRFRFCSFVALAVAALEISGTVRAGSITYFTPPGATNPTSGQPVNMTATFTTSTDQIVVVVNNLLVNPTDVS
jgi:hypothetical protein